MRSPNQQFDCAITEYERNDTLSQFLRFLYK